MENDRRNSASRLAQPASRLEETEQKASPTSLRRGPAGRHVSWLPNLIEDEALGKRVLGRWSPMSSSGLVRVRHLSPKADGDIGLHPPEFFAEFLVASAPDRETNSVFQFRLVVTA